MSRVVFFIALRQLWDRKLLNAIAVLGVTLGVLTLISINAIMQGFQVKFLANIIKVSPHVSLYDKELRPAPSLLSRFYGEHVVAKVEHEAPSDRQQRLRRPEEMISAIEQLDGVRAAAGSLVGSAVLSFGPKQLPVDLRGIVGAKQDRVTPIGQFVKEGSLRELDAAPDGILLGAGVATRLGAKTGDALLAGTATGQRLTLHVVGIFEAEIPPVDNSRVYVSLHNAQSLLGKPDVVGRIDLRLFDEQTAPEVAERCERIFGYDAESWQEANANFLGLFVMQNTIIAFVVGAILLVGGFGILAIQIMIVLQKTKDIAILRSVGFTRRDVLSIFLLQGAIVAFTGAVLGEVVGHNLVAFLGTLKTKQEGLVKSDSFLVYDDPQIYVYGFAFAMIVGLVASLVPALRGSRVEPVDVLRGQIG
jgi:lipoprotein-releasing system permease protein